MFILPFTFIFVNTFTNALYIFVWFCYWLLSFIIILKGSHWYFLQGMPADDKFSQFLFEYALSMSFIF